MLRAIEVKPAGRWSGPPVDAVTLDYDDRHRRRIVMTGTGGTRFLLDLERATVLHDGDGLVLDDGRIVAIRAAPEHLAEIVCASAADLVRVAWHLGNRHLPTQICGHGLRIRFDHVIVDMVQKLGASVRAVEAPFDPEGGAYAQGAAHHHVPDGETLLPVREAAHHHG